MRILLNAHNAFRCALARTLLLSATAAILHGQTDVVMDAMKDELARSMKQLTVENLEKAYFISYRIVDSDNVSVAASFGSLNHSNAGRSRLLTVEVRVGDYKLDNSHFFSLNLDPGTRLVIFNGTVELGLQDDYKEIRRQLWLATDATYKKAVEDLSSKRALFQNRSREDEADDFTREDPVTASQEQPPVKVDIPKWENEARSISAVFRKMPGIYTSTITFNCVNSYTRFLTSEGTSYTRRQSNVMFNSEAATQAADGAPLDDFVWFHARSLAGLPSEQELTASVQALGQRLSDLRDASTLMNYNGPVLAEGDAAAQLFRLVFLPSLIGAKPTISGLPGAAQAALQGLPGLPGNQGENPFLDKIGARVLPEFLSVTDNPTIEEYQNHHMSGFSKVDEDGMRSREVPLVEKGILKTLLTSRDPVRGINHSTGSRHAGSATPSNVIVTASTGLSEADLRARFLELVKQRNLPFGIAVRRMRNVANAVLAYKVFPDGHEELVRNVQFFGLNAAAFKDIVAGSSSLNFLTVRFEPPRNNPLSVPIEENFTPVSLAVPSLVFEDVTVRRGRGAAPTPPVAGHPYFDKQ
jgi:PmbA/TldA metallopeptidase C-terminal domain